MAKYVVRYSKLYKKWQVLRKTFLGVVVLEEFERKDDALACAERLVKKRKRT